MDRSLRLAAASALLMGVSGCNNVVSNEPWFTAADTEGAPELREGLWVMITEHQCRVNLDRPAERWPDCANPLYLRGQEWLAMQWADADRPGRRMENFRGWESLAIVIAAGDPAILQLDEGDESDASASESDDDGARWRYSFAGLRPTESDSQGRVVTAEFWSVQCGPLRLEVKAGTYTLDELTELAATERPFPGLTLVGNRCTAESADALRRAAASSGSLAQPGLMRWVRDGWR